MQSRWRSLQSTTFAHLLPLSEPTAVWVLPMISWCLHFNGMQDTQKQSQSFMSRTRRNCQSSALPHKHDACSSPIYINSYVWPIPLLSVLCADTLPMVQQRQH